MILTFNLVCGTQDLSHENKYKKAKAAPPLTFYYIPIVVSIYQINCI